jgi:hypothetical protein
MKGVRFRRAWLAAGALVLLAAPVVAAEVTFEKPGIITSIGQSSDVAIVKVMLNTRLKLGLDYKPTAQVADLSGMKTLVVVIGASTKGLGAAGLDMVREIERTIALLKAAREKGAARPPTTWSIWSSRNPTTSWWWPEATRTSCSTRWRRSEIRRSSKWRMRRRPVTPSRRFSGTSGAGDLD